MSNSPILLTLVFAAGCSSAGLNGGSKSAAGPASGKATEPSATASAPSNTPAATPPDGTTPAAGTTEPAGATPSAGTTPPPAPPGLEKADPATETTGAYLTECGTAPDERAAVSTAAASDTIYGCAIVDKAGAKLRDYAIKKVVATTVTATKEPTLVPADTASRWHVLFALTNVESKGLTGFDVTSALGAVETTQTAKIVATTPGASEPANPSAKIQIQRYKAISGSTFSGELYEPSTSAFVPAKASAPIAAFQAYPPITAVDYDALLELVATMTGPGINILAADETMLVIRVKKASHFAYVNMSEYKDDFESNGWQYEDVAFRLNGEDFNSSNNGLCRVRGTVDTDAYRIVRISEQAAAQAENDGSWDWSHCVAIGFEPVSN